MLKIYYKRTLYFIRDGDMIYDVDFRGRHVIEDEEVAKNYDREYNIYSDNINSICNCCGYYEGKRGAVVTVYGHDCFLKFKSWKHPNVKLIEVVEYADCVCSMRELSYLPADQVIAYLKQEGLNLTLTN